MAKRVDLQRRAKGQGPANVAIARAIGITIATGDAPPGSLLPGEIDMAEERGVSRSVIRESLRMLAAKGLVESRPKAGTRVRARRDWNMLDPELLSWMFEGAPSLDFVRDLFALRLIIEPAAAEVAALSRSDAHLAALAEALRLMAHHGLGSAEGQTADQRFHAVILEATGNQVLTSLSASITAAVRWTTFFKYRMSVEPRDPIPQHQRLLDAIAAADPAAARGMTVTLIQSSYKDMEAALVRA